MKIVKSRTATYVLQALGCVACGGVGFMLALMERPCAPQLVPAPAVIGATPAEPTVRPDDGELRVAKQRIAELEKRLSELSVQVVRPVEDVPASTPDVTATGIAERSEQERREALSWRVSAVEKFVPLTEEQKLRLRKKYEAEAKGATSGVETDTLEEIIGQENAIFYRQQVKSAFQKVKDEELNKEVVWLARQLNLSAQQEQAVQQGFQSIEAQLVQASSQDEGAGGSSHDRVKVMIEENRKRNELRAAQMKELLSPEQYQAYAKTQAESSSSDVEVFHDSGGK